MPTIKFRDRRVFFKDEGSGKAMVLLHGFTESLKIWSRFSKKLSAGYRVITIDLPGHGKTEPLGVTHTMEIMADMVYAVLKELGVGKCLMAGHSMGGYVTLAFAAKYPGKLKGFCLFHSHCFPDSPADKENRARTIEVVRQDKFSYIARFIPGLFPEEVHEKYAEVIRRMVEEAAGMPKEGVIASLEGMMIRRDQSELLRTTRLPVLFILGLKDSRAPLSRLCEMISLPAVSEVLLLRECGHMGYIEAPEVTCDAFSAFARQVL